MCSCSWKNIGRVLGYLPYCSLLLLGCSEIETKWSRTFDALGPGNYQINSIQGSKKEIYVTGTYTDASLDTKCFTAKYSKEGRLQWHQVFKTEDYDQTIGTARLVMRTQEELLTARDDVYVLAQAINKQRQREVILIQYDTLGNLQWHKTVNKSDGPLTSSLLSDYEGNLYVTGWEENTETGSTIYLGKYGGDGVTSWLTKYYNEEIVFDQLCFDIMVPEHIVTAGLLENTGNLFYIRFDGLGQFQGFVEYATETQLKDISDVKTDPDGNIYLSATVWNQDTGEDFLVMAYDKHDSLLWVNEYDGAASGDDVSKAIALDESLNVYVTGSSKNEQDIPNIAIVKYDQTGNLVWAINKDQSSAAQPFLIEPRYLRLDRKTHRRYFYVAGTINDDAQILRCNVDGVFSFQAQYGEREKVTIPTALSEECMALQSSAENTSEALVVMTGPSVIYGIVRWD